MQRSTKGIREELESARIEFAKVGKRARQILANAKAQGVDLNAEESAEFDQLAGGKYDSGQLGVIKNNIATLEAELAEAEATEQRILTKGYGMHTTSNNSNFSGDNAPRLVLPKNGVLPNNSPRYAPHGRIGRLTAFRDEQSAYDSGVWLQAVASRVHGNVINSGAEGYLENIGISIENAMSEGVGSAGGYTVPAVVANALIAVREAVGVTRAACDVYPMTSDTHSVPKRSSGLTVYAPGEGDAISTSDMGFGQVALIAKKRAVACYVSQELSDDSLINMADLVFTEMAYALALQEDNELINGTGAATTYFGVRGLLNRIGTAGVSQAATGHDTWPELDIADFAACVAKLPAKYHQYNPSWICSPNFFYAAMARIAFNAGGVTMSEILSATPQQRSFMGYPVYLTSQMPTATAAATNCALFGAFNRGVAVGDRGGVSMGRSEHYRFLNDQLTFKATESRDINVYEPGDTSTAGAYVSLKTAA